jgi:CDP-paratose synthetase
MKTVLITGVNGFLGSNLANRFINKYNIIGLEYSLQNLLRISGLDFKIYDSKQILEKIFKENKIDYIIHTATLYSSNKDSIMPMIETNMLLPIRLMELAQKYTCSSFINTDTFFNDSSISYNYLGDYTLTKKHALDWLLNIQSKTKLVTMKLFHMYGPNDNKNKFVSSLLQNLQQNKPEILLTSGLQKRDFIYVDDVVDAYDIVIGNIDRINAPFSEFQVGSGKAVSIKDFVLTASKLTQSESKLLFGRLQTRDGEIMHSQADNKGLYKFGWIVKNNLDDGIKKTINYLSSR